MFGECEPVTLLDESGQPSGYTLACTELQPNPPVETDTFEVTLGDMELRFPGGGTETIAVEGPTVVHVYFEGETEGSADDDDGDGRDDVASRMVQLDLQGTSSLGPVKVRLNPALPSDGQIEEQANNTPGVLDLPPFTPVGTADSFFDIFFEIEVGGQAYHTATPKHMAAILAHKPPATVDLYGNCDEVELLDTNGQPTGIYLVCAHHQPTTPIEIDVFPFSLGKLEILFPDTTTHTVNVSGPTTVHVHFADIEGHASDSDGDGRDDVVTEMVEMNLTGFTPTLGPVAVHLNTARPTLGEIEEQVNNTPGVLDVPPFAATGTADSFFDIFFEIEVGGNVYHNETAKRMTAVIDHKPPRAVTWYSNCDAIELYDAAGAPTGIKILCARHQPNPVVERDLFDLALGAVSLRLPTGDTVAVDLHGKAEQVVIFEGTEEGDASDDNGDGLEEVLAELVSLDLHGVAGPLGPVAVRLDPLRTSHGEINELVNATPGVLDVPPFTATGTADSFFDVFLEIEIAGVKLTTDHPMRIHGRLSHKPAAPGEGFTCLGPQVPLDLLDDSGQSTGFALLCTDLTPIPEGDFGDAPERTYPTVLASNGAYHTLTASLLMGRQVDAEPDGQPSPNADGDDLNGPGPNDEDGVLAWRGVWPGNPAAEVDVVVVGKGLLQVWLDLDGDGFGPEDQIIADWPVATGAHTISFAVPAGARMPPITLAMSRFRLSPVAGLGPAGFGGTGEVEDHVVEVSPPPPSSLQGMKWHDLDGDCALNGNELPLQGWTIYLLDADGNVVVTAQTGEDGRYAFTVPAGSYTVQEENRPFWGQTCPHNGGTWHVTVRPGEAVAGLIFGNRELLDFGDAPDTAAAPKYPTLLAHDGARHHIDAAVYLGTRIDGETDAYVSAAADGDDTYGTAGDDEDGVYFVSPLFFGADAKVSVRASAAGKLDAWLDFTADGDWDDAGEQIFATQALVAGNNILTFTVPLAAAGTHAITLARFRFSSAGGLGCDGEAADGEVEDYLVTIFEKPQGHFKWQQPPVGDPDSLHPDDFWGWDETSVYGVQAIVADDWQCNTAQPVTDIHWWGSYLGYTDDVPPADGPELFHLAIWTDAPIDLGADPPVAFSRPAKLVWETWAPRAALNERFVRYDFHPDHPDRRDACFQYDFDIPWNDWFIQSDGENVYWLSIAAIYPAGHCVEEGGGAGVPTPCHPWGWLTRPHKYGDDAVRILAPLKPEPGSLFESGEPVTDLAGASWDMAFMLTTRPVGVIEGAKWRDDDGDGLWKVGEPAIPGAKVYVDLDNDSVCDEDEPAVWTDGSGAYRLENIPAGTWPVREEVSDCWRQTYPAGGAAHVITLEPGGTAIEIHFGNQPLCDWGDAPERPYQTTAAAKGARHRATPNLCLGAASDIEPDGQPTTAADGDDNNGADDEDGVTNWQGLWAGNPAATVDVTVTGTGLLSAWIDFAGDGFDTGGDQIAADLAVTSGTHSLSFAVPSGLAAGNLLVARFRLSATAYLPWCGPAPDGEVEDYVIATTETPGSEVRGRKWNDLDGDGVQGNGEAGLPGWPVYLAQLGGLTVAKTTEMDGTFAFAGVAPGEYRLYEGQQESWRQTCPASPDGYTFTIVGGQTVEGKDFGNLHLLDWGDAPDGVAAPGYPTLATHEGASHVIAGPRLGEAVDADFDGQPTAGADGDDTDADGNDEDGVTFDGPLQAGSWAQADVVLSNATDALLAAWIDFNRDGDWGDAGEQVADDFALAVGTTELPFLVPADALPGQTYARFRLSSQSVSVGGQAPDGEVEDYLVLIRPAALEADADLGDAPDSTNTAGAVMSAYGSSATPASFPTVYRAGSPPYGPIHLHPGALAWLGSEVSLEGEADTGPDADALNNLDPAADAANQDGDDDALDDAPYLPHCEPTRFAFSLSTLAAQSATLYVNVWLDFNRDGDWNDTLACDGVSAVPEWAVQNLAVGVTGTGTLLLVTPPFLSWTPADVADHPLWLRITLAEQPWNPQGGIAPDGGSGPASGYQYGETEDYLITPSVVPLAIDFGDAPEVSGAAFHYPTLLGSNGAAHLIVEGAPYFGKDGDQPDADADGQPTPLADGDDYDTDGDDENGVYVPTLIPGQTGRFSVSIGGAAGHVTGWVDLDGNGVWEDDERLLDAFHPTGTSDWGIPIPADAKVGQTYARFRISTTRQGLPTGLAPDGEVEDHLVFIREAPEQLDWGDAPQNYDFRYPTKAGANGARHCIAGPWLGSDNDAPDAETDGQPDANARGDNANGADDENGVFIPPLPKGGTATLTFQVSGMKATVRGWIDFNADLDWDDPGEQVVFGPYDVGLHTVTVDVPADAVIGQTFARFRISTHRDMGPAGLAPNGEVEDYAVRVVEPPVTLDFGDAPELTDTQGLFLGYPTTLAHDGARHFIAGPWLGSDSDAPDPEADGKPEPLALGDDTDAAGDDENGVLIPPMIPGETVTIAFQVNGGGGWVSGWIDFNADRIWANPGERVVHAYYADGAHTETVAVPAKAVVGPSFARFRITTQAYAPALTAVLELGPTGLARDGEVEDHIVHIKEPPVALDFGDAPEIPGALSYPTTLAHDGARHYIAGPYFGTDGTDLPDGESDGQPTAAAFGDDSDSGGDDEDGILLSTLVRGQNGTATFHVMGGGHVRAWIDFNGDGDWDDGDEMVVDSFYTEGEYGLIFHVPSDAALGRTYARFRITTSQAAFGATGLLPDGEVEDHATRIAEAPVTYDFGDAPTAAAVPGYPTLLAQDGARHAIGGPWFGEDETDAPDAETDGQPEATALGDDNDAAGDDENDILFRPLVIGLPNAVTLNLSGGGGVVKIWIDFNGNKAWEAGELVHVGEHGSGGHTFNIAVPANAQPGITFARCRVSSNGGFGIVGEAPDGEVEDHAVLLVREMPGLDFGDAPDAANAAGYPTLLAHDGARHYALGAWLGDDGDAPDTEDDGTPQPDALGDDTTSSDDENGVAFLDPLVPGANARLTFQVSGMGAYLNGWVDYDRNGAWESGEQVVSGYWPVGTHTITLRVPTEAQSGETYARFRLSPLRPALDPVDLAFYGEVEDLLAVITPESGTLDFGDAPAADAVPGYPTRLADDGARHTIGGPWLGDANDRPDNEADGQPDGSALGDDHHGSDDEDGVVIPPLERGSGVGITLQVSGMGGYVRGWIDFNGNRAWDDPAERVVDGYFGVGFHTVNVSVPPGAEIGQTFARFRIATRRGLSPAGYAADGEVEDLVVAVTEPLPPMDYGDAPETAAAAGYPTLYASNGARHVLGVPATPYLGEAADIAPDADPDGLPTPTASGDDSDGGDDENGVAFTTLLAPGRTATVKITAPAGGFLDAWIDFNADGDWQDDGEQVFTSTDLNALPGGEGLLDFAAPTTAKAGANTHARFRVSSRGGLSYDGQAADGEVEDHPVRIGFVLTLVYGWNLFSVPLEPDRGDPGIHALFTDPQFKGPVTTLGPDGYEEVTEADGLHPLIGYWVLCGPDGGMEDTVEIPLSGSLPPTSTTAELPAGWSLVGPVADIEPPDETDDPAIADYFWKLDHLSPDQPFYNIVLPTEKLERGHGYWIYLKTPTSLPLGSTTAP
ncbi:MAG: Cna protein B-type domain protein [Lentisphaerae bacterium ADurb.BinA184]|nr:MAG: Cna protein B-type domain protein [Lentisphaerae bacterium ADurb.BinA184]